MKFITIVALVSLLGSLVSAQENKTPRPASLYDVAMPSELMTQTFPDCVKELKALGASVNKAIDSCEKRFSRESKRSEKVAEVNKPQVVYNGAGYYGNSGIYSTGPVATYSFSECSRALATVGGRGCR